MVTANEINKHFIINTICNGDADKALKIAREYPRVQITLTPKSIERYLILEYIEVGLNDYFGGIWKRIKLQVNHGTVNGTSLSRVTLSN